MIKILIITCLIVILTACSTGNGVSIKSTPSPYDTNSTKDQSDEEPYEETSTPSPTPDGSSEVGEKESDQVKKCKPMGGMRC